MIEQESKESTYLVDWHLDGEMRKSSLAGSDGSISRVVGRVPLAMGNGTKGLEEVTDDTDTEELEEGKQEGLADCL
jgi:hypothetical protein